MKIVVIPPKLSTFDIATMKTTLKASEKESKFTAGENGHVWYTGQSELRVHTLPTESLEISAESTGLATSL